MVAGGSGFQADVVVAKDVQRGNGGRDGPRGDHSGARGRLHWGGEIVMGRAQDIVYKECLVNSEAILMWGCR